MKQHSQLTRESSSDSNSIIRCAIYTRKSTEEGLDRDFNTLDAQRETAEAYIESQKNEGWICLPEHYDDGGFTGGNMDRPAMQCLMADIEADKIDCIVVYKVDRLSRSLMDFSRIMTILEQHDVSFVSVTQQFNTTHSMGRLTLNILLSFSQFEREIISERTRDKKTAARKKGKWIGGTPMLGYDIDPRGGRLIVNQEEAFRVRKAFEIYLDYQSLQATAKEMNNRGWTTKYYVSRNDVVHGGKPFGRNTLVRLLNNITYIGKVNFDGKLYNGEHQAIIEVDKWQSVQDILKRNRLESGTRVRNKYGALLKGLLYCMPCKSPMIHTVQVNKHKNTRYRFYVCSRAQIHGWHTCPTKSVPVASIEEFVIDRIRNIGRDNDFITEVFNQVRNQLHGGSERLRSELWILNEGFKHHTNELDRLMNDSKHHLNDRSCFSIRRSELEDQIQNAKQRIDDIHEEIANANHKQLDEKEMTSALHEFDPIWEALNPRERIRLIHLIVKRIDYHGAEGLLNITFHETGIKKLTEEIALA